MKKTLEINKCKKHWKLINEITLEINYLFKKHWKLINEITLEINFFD